MSKYISPWKLVMSAFFAFGLLAIFNKAFGLFLDNNGINREGFIEGIFSTYISAIIVGAVVGVCFACILKRSLLPKERLWFIWPYGIITTSLYVLAFAANYFTNDFTSWGILDFLIKAPIYPLFAYLFLSDKFINLLVQNRT